MIELLKKIDTSLFSFLNGINNPLLDITMPYITGNIIWIPFYSILLFMLYKKFNLKQFLMLLVFIALCITLTDQISVRCFKEVFLRYRPCHNLELMKSIHLVGNCGGLYGFISSHAANVFGVLALIAPLLASKKMWFILLVWACLISYSRIYLGVHYPFDILAGAILGLGIGTSVLLVFRKFAANV